jgi:methanogenesis imperfect marker protein 11
MLRIARSCTIGHLLEHKIVQLNPNVPEKTTNCVSVGVSFAVAEKDVEKLIEFFTENLRKETFSQQTTLAVHVGLKIPDEVVEYGLRAKREIFKKEQAKEVADRNGIRIIEVTGSRGTIGAVAGIGCFDLGLMAAGLPEDF